MAQSKESIIVGVDEAGRGPLAGCVVSCALMMRENVALPLKDSKQLSPLKRESSFEVLRHAAVFSVGVASMQEIDSLNVLQATFLSFNRAIHTLLQREPSLKDALFIIDGNKFYTQLPIKYRCVTQADARIYEVAYASIIAKVFRDYLMDIADFLFPEWQFRVHKGYPTKLHRELIRQFCLSPLHRRTFCKKEMVH